MRLATSFTVFISLLAVVKGQSATGDGDDPSLPTASDDPSSKQNVAPIVVPIVVVVVVIGLLTCGGLVMYRRSRRNGNNNLKLLFFGKTPTLALDTASESHGSSSDEDGQAGGLESGVDSTTKVARKAASKKSKKRNGPQKDSILGEGSPPIDTKELAAVVSNFFHGLPDENGSNNNNNMSQQQQQPKKMRQPSLGTTAIRILEAAGGADHDIELAAAAQEAEEAYSVYSGSTLSIFGDSTQASGDTREHHKHHRRDTPARAPPEVRVATKAADENDAWTAFRQEAGWPSGSSVEKVVGKKRHVRCSLHL